MSRNGNGDQSTAMAPDDWPTEPERRYAALQAQLADRYDLAVDSRIVETDTAGRIHYLVTGNPDGDPVLLLHGLTGQAAYWLPLVSAFADRYRLYAPDMPGEGLSAKPSYRGRDHRSFLTAYLVELLDALELERPPVVGHSFGGWQAFLLALDHDRVGRLCLVGAPAGLSRDYPLPVRLLTVRGLNRLLLWAMTRGDPVESAQEWIRRFSVVDDSAVPSLYYELFAVRPELPGLMHSLRTLLVESASFGRMIPLTDISDEVADIERPTAFIWGTEDYFWDPDLGRRVADRMADATFHELPGHGHTPWLEPGDEAESLVRSVLDG